MSEKVSAAITTLMGAKASSTPRPKIQLRLRHIETMALNRGEHTLYALIIAALPRLGNLGSDDVILVRSKRGDQLIFIYGFFTIPGAPDDEDGTRTPRQYLRSERLRLSDRAPWHPLMLQDYANQVGINLQGVPTLAEHLAKIARARAKLRASILRGDAGSTRPPPPPRGRAARLTPRGRA